MPLYDQCLAKMAHKMSENFIFHNIKTAPEQSTPLLEELFAQSGPNGFYAVMGGSPEALSGYNARQQAFSASSFHDQEKTVIWQAINVKNECHNCVPAHTLMAKAMKVSDQVINALGDETELQNAKLEALRVFTLTLLHNRCHDDATLTLSAQKRRNAHPPSRQDQYLLGSGL